MNYRPKNVDTYMPVVDLEVPCINPAFLWRDLNLLCFLLKIARDPPNYKKCTQIYNMTGATWFTRALEFLISGKNQWKNQVKMVQIWKSEISATINEKLAKNLLEIFTCGGLFC